MLSAVIGPSRSDRTTCPDPVEAWRQAARASASAALLCRAITQLDDIADLASRVDHHVPRQACDLASAQAGFRRQQDNYSIADRMAGASGKNQEIVDLGDGQYFRLLAWHVSNQDNMICIAKML
jgi:hypothetical protein